jgi:hypothetical protein
MNNHDALPDPVPAEGAGGTPLESLPFPVRCVYPGCGAGPFGTPIAVDEHITEEHLPEAVWTFATEHMKEQTW